MMLLLLFLLPLPQRMMPKWRGRRDEEKEEGERREMGERREEGRPAMSQRAEPFTQEEKGTDVCVCVCVLVGSYTIRQERGENAQKSQGPRPRKESKCDDPAT